MPCSWLGAWSSHLGTAQLIGQLEILPALVAKFLWRSRLTGRRTIYFMDSDSARQAAIKGSSPNELSGLILEAMSEEDLEILGDGWFERVAGASNPADGPSRLQFEAMEALNGKRVMMPPTVRRLPPPSVTVG